VSIELCGVSAEPCPSTSTSFDTMAGAGMADARAKGIVAISFLGGILLAAAMVAPSVWEPIPEPFFGLEKPVPVATPLPQQPAIAVSPAPKASPPVGDLSSMAAAMPAVVKPGPRPERLAMAPIPATAQELLSRQPAIAQVLPPRPAEARPPRRAPQPIADDASPPVPEPLVIEPADASSLKSLVTRVHIHRLAAEAPTASTAAIAETPSQPARIEPPVATDSLGAAPLPGAAWSDPDSVNWTDANAQPRLAASPGPGIGQPPGSGRLFDRLRKGERIFVRGRREGHDDDERLTALQSVPDVRRPGCLWPHPATLISDLHELHQTQPDGMRHEHVEAWSRDTLNTLGNVLLSAGPRDPAAATTLIVLGEAVHRGMELADRITEGSVASDTRRAALAVSRRVAIWRAAAGMLAAPLDSASGQEQAQPATRDPHLTARCEADVGRLLESLERYEISCGMVDAAVVKETMRTIEAASLPGAAAVVRAVDEHYLSPNVRVAVHQAFIEKLLPEAEEETGPVNEIISGRQVRGTRTVTRATAVRFVPDHDEIAMLLEIQGDITSRSVTDAGPVSLTSRAASSFVVRKPLKVSPHGLLFGPATGTASNNSQLAGIQTSFDAVPVMRSLVRQLAKSQHDDALPDVNREVINKIVARACRETDETAEPQLAELAERVRQKLWMPLVRLGLEPTPVVLETSASLATLRLRLAADTQVAAHTPRPRAPTDAHLNMQLHESAINNALERLALAGQRFSLENLCGHVCERIGIERLVPEDLPEGVEVTFARSEPVRVTCADGLVQVRVTLEALESSRRNWYDVIAQVSYRPVVAGPQVFLEREGPIRISGPGHQGRMEIALRTIFGKIFPKERPLPVVPERFVANPRLEGMRAVQAVSHDGWFALALATREPPATVAAPQKNTEQASRPAIFR
jgi:hypothetical protein